MVEALPLNAASDDGGLSTDAVRDSIRLVAGYHAD